MSGIPGMRRKRVRVAVCHPELLHHAKGLCKNCYQHKINHELRSGARIPQPRRNTEWPQAVVKVPVRGWGFIG